MKRTLQQFIKYLALIIPILLSSSLFIYVLCNTVFINKEINTNATINENKIEIDLGIWGQEIYQEGVEDGINKMYNTLSLGLTIVGIAVSIWVALNIYNIIEKDQVEKLQEEIKNSQNNLKALEKDLENMNKDLENTNKDFIDLRKNFKNNLKTLEKDLENMNKDFIDLRKNFKNIDFDLVLSLDVLKLTVLSTSMQFDEIPSRWFKEKILKSASDITFNQENENERFSLIANLISKFNRLENSYICLRKNEQSESRVKFGKDGLEIGKELCNNNKILEKLNSVEKVYLYFRTAEICYYLGDELLGNNKEEALEYLKSSLKYYEKAIFLDKDINADGYLDNTIGGVYLNIATCSKDKIEKQENNKIALEYFEKAISTFSGRAVYHKQKGVALQRLNGETQDIINCYQKALELDEFYGISNYRNYLTLAGIYLKQLSQKLHILPIKNRITTLNKISLTLNDIQQRDIVALIEKIEPLYKEAIKIAPNKPESFYKFGELYTYKYLFYKILNNNSEMDINKEQAESNFNLCNKINNSYKPLKFQQRNYYEAIGNIEQAITINQYLIDNNAGGDEYEWKEYIENFYSQK